MTSTNNLKHVFLMPCWGGKIKENFNKTVLCPVKPSTIFSAVPEKTRTELEVIFGGKDMAVWGSMDGSNNRLFFGKMQPGDYMSIPHLAWVQMFCKYKIDVFRAV